jgi:hypothetical protein
MPVQGRLALPATISIQQGQNRLMQEMDEMDNDPTRPVADEPRKPDLSEHVTVLATSSGPVEFSRQMMEERLVERTAMKAPPKRSALDGPVNMNSTVEVANELLNEIQRTRGTDKIVEDESLYRVAVRFPGKDGAPEWKAELTGPPSFHPLKTVNLVIVGKKVVALDRQNRKLWEQSAGRRTMVRGMSGPLLSVKASFSSQTRGCSRRWTRRPGMCAGVSRRSVFRGCFSTSRECFM